MLKDEEPRLALFCFAWDIFCSFDPCESGGLCQGEAGELPIGASPADGSQGCAEAICLPLCKRCFLHLRVGFKRFARQEEGKKNAAGAVSGAAGVKWVSSRNRGGGEEGTPETGKESLSVGSWKFSSLFVCIVLDRRYYLCHLVSPAKYVSPQEDSVILLLSFTSLKRLHLPHFYKLLL